MQKHIGKPAAKRVAAPLKVSKAADFKHDQAPEKFTYALAAHTAERRKDGWWVGKSVASFSGEKPKWSGPFADIENACLSIARQLFTELADRHTRSTETHRIASGDPLFGLKPTTRLRARKG
jgi:hypothetical protein